MFFSKLQFDPLVLAKASKAHNAYAAHQLVWRAFPSAPDTPRDFVFRQEVSDVGATFGRRALVFYVVSKRRPNVDGFGSAEVKLEVKPYHPQLQSGQRFSISLRANPVVSKCAERASTGERKPPKRHDVLMEAKRLAKQQNLAPAEWQEAQRQAVLEWWIRQSEAFGFRVDEEKLFAINGYRQHVLPRRKRQSKEQTIQFSSVDITGIIEVREPEQLQKALFQGLGKAKGFGCGLLLLRPL